VRKKKRILLIGDTPGWAFHRIIEFIIQQVEGFDFYFDFTVNHPRVQTKTTSDFVSKGTVTLSDTRRKLPFQNIVILRALVYHSIKFLHRIGLSKYDEHGFLKRVTRDSSYDLVVYLDYYMDKDGDFSHIRADKMIKGIFTEQFPPKGVIHHADITIEAFCQDYLRDSQALLVGAPSIEEVYCQHFKSPIFFANLCYDETLFIPKKRMKNKVFIIGWTGNPDRDFKGFYTHVIPTVNTLKTMGYPVELRTQFVGSLESLAWFWQEVDLALITSDADAGPSMFIEASLCGVPSVSTKIGLPQFVINHGENGLFCERNVKDMVLAIQQILDDSLLYHRIQSNIRASYVEKLGVEAQKKRWENIFNAMLYE
jgi:glycosyltransferase involved in cell wall biosynthesis